MNPYTIAFLSINSILLFFLPRRWAPMPLLVGACYISLGQGVEIGPFHFTVIRILIAVGLIRVVVKSENIADGMNSLDWLMLVWAGWAMVSSLFHKPPSQAFVNRLGLAYNSCGIYFLVRVFCQCSDDLRALCRCTAILLIPVAVGMLYEVVAIHNLYSLLGGVPDTPQFREGRFRAFGPFAHPILAGTVGATCLPLLIGIWPQDRKFAFAGVAACFCMIFASASSGPILSAMAAFAALFMWRYKAFLRQIQWLAVLGLIALAVAMKAPVYYLIARMDLTGGSTGWHRAALIESAIRQIDEWWMAGTDYTRHWMPTGVSWSPDHTDITNEYLNMGVIGGLPLMSLFIATLAVAFIFVGRIQQGSNDLPGETRFMIWGFGAALFAHAVSFISVSYFDQSILFVYMTLAAIGSAYSGTVTTWDGNTPEVA